MMMRSRLRRLPWPGPLSPRRRRSDARSGGARWVGLPSWGLVLGALLIGLPLLAWADRPSSGTGTATVRLASADAPTAAATGTAAAKARRLRVTIAMLPSPGVAEDVQVAVQRDLGEALRKNARLDMKDLDVRLAEFAQEMPFDQVELARTTLQKGREALFKMEIDGAIAQLSDAVDQLIAVLPYIKKQELADAMMAVAVAHFQKGKTPAMQQALKRLFVWRPNYTADPAQVPPQMNEAVEAARQQVGQLPRADLQVSSEPSGAQVFVDGDYIGVAPLSVPGLAVGEHYITLKKLGYKRGLRVAQVKESGGSPVVGKLTRSDKYLLVEQAVVKVAGQMGQSPIDSVVDNLRETLFLDQTVFVKLRKLTGDDLELSAHLYDLRSRQLISKQTSNLRVQNSVPQVGALATAADRLYSGVDYDGGLRAPVDKPPPAPADTRPLYKRWWFWAAVGVIAAGTVTAIAVAASQRNTSCPSGHVCTGSVGLALSY